ncbi:nitronate monooxygenase family protein [Lachnospiraceae bacterium OttesenSCG-928-E19]|nr:nitronate monooxygenase family protein [Lachnospiraceae bacterium OttesenSCG-928-E19]
MKRGSLVIGDLEAKVPIVQGGMGVGISLGNLAGHVALEGGIGIISAAQIGYREADFLTHTKEANERAIHKEYEKAREISPKGIIGFNIMVAMKHYADYVKEAIRAGADIIISGAGLPVDLPEYVKGSETKIAPIVSTKKSANVILKYWDRKYKRTADAIVIEGPKAGGHLGFTGEQLEEFDEDTYEQEVLSIIDVVKKYAEKYLQKIPIILAGGIENREQVNHAFEIGADGVQVGSRFVTTEECDAAKEYKESYIRAEEKDIAIVKSPVGMPGRAIMNSFMKKVTKGEKFSPTKCLQCLEHCNPKEIPYCITERLVYAAQGKVEEALLFCGEYAYKAREMQTVRGVMEELMGDY